MSNNYVMTYGEYKVLKTINNINKDNTDNEYNPDFIFMNRITDKLKYKSYKINVLMRNLDDKGYITILYNKDNKNIYGASVADPGKMALKYYYTDTIIYLFDKYIWMILISVITAFFTEYFAHMLVKWVFYKQLKQEELYRKIIIY